MVLNTALVNMSPAVTAERPDQEQAQAQAAEEPSTQLPQTSVPSAENEPSTDTPVSESGAAEETEAAAESDGGAAEAQQNDPAESSDSPSSAAENASEQQPVVSDTRIVTTDSCLIRENCTDAQWEEIVALWEMIPSDLREKFKSDGWTMVATSNDFWSVNGYERIAAMTDFDHRTCYIRADNARLAVCVAHEFGHYIDQANGWPSRSEAFAAIYASEKEGFSGYLAVDDHYVSDTTEYFAQIFCQIIVAPDTASSAPESFAFVEQFF